MEKIIYYITKIIVVAIVIAISFLITWFEGMFIQMYGFLIYTYNLGVSLGLTSNDDTAIIEAWWNKLIILGIFLINCFVISYIVKKIKL